MRHPLTDETSFLVHGRWMLGAESADCDAALIRGRTIAEVGSYEVLRARNPDLAVIGGPNTGVLPGFVNAHHHASGISLILQGIADDMLEPWLLATLAAAPQSDFYATQLSAAAMMKSGVTSVVDMCRAGADTAGLRRRVEEKAAAYRQVGLRAAIVPGAREKNMLVHADGEEDDFARSLPAHLRALAQRIIATPAIGPDDYVTTIAELAQAYDDDPLIDIWFGPPGPQWVEEATFGKLARMSAERNIRVQTHALESFFEKLAGPRVKGVTAIETLDALGLLAPRLSIAHGVWLTDDDIAGMVESGAHLVHNPSSNLRLKCGIAPIARAWSAGMRPALGMDGNAMAEDEDFFAEMRLALRLGHSPHLGEPSLTAAMVFEMATRNGASLLGRELDLGRLAPGARADLVLVGLERITAPWISSAASPLEVIVQRAQPRDVESVIIEGQVVVNEGRVLTIDEARVAGELAESLASWAPSASERAALSELGKHLMDWYARWPTPPLRPHTQFNSSA